MKEETKTKAQLVKKSKAHRRNKAKTEKSPAGAKKGSEQEADRLRKKADALNAINWVFHEGLTCKTREQVAAVCLSAAERLTKSQFGFICEVNSRGRLDTIAISDNGWSACRIPGSRDLLLANDLEVRGIRGRIIKEGRSIIFNDPTSHPYWLEPPEGHPKIVRFLGVPFTLDGKTIGMVGLANKGSRYTQKDQQTVEDLSTAFLVALMHRRAEQKREHLNLVLRAIRNVNQIIVREKDRKRLIQSACQSLIETRGYDNAWIALLNESGEVITTAHAGLGDDLSDFVDRIKKGEPIHCMELALSREDVLFIEDPQKECGDCPIATRSCANGVIVVRLHHNSTLFGCLAVSLPTAFAMDEQERSLVAEVADDIAFALHAIKTEKERGMAESEVDRLGSAVDQSTEGIAIADADPNPRLTYVNGAFAQMHGYSPAEMIGMEVARLHNDEQVEAYKRKMEEIRAQGSWSGEIDHVKKDGTPFPTSMSVTLLKDDHEKPVGIVAVAKDITAELLARERQNFAAQILGILNQSIEEVDVVRQILLLIKSFSGVEAAGLRLKEGDDFPYYEANGFPEPFVKAEQYLCARDAEGQLVRDAQGSPVLECMCGNVICGRTNPSLSFFTKGGSFWTNGTTELLASTTEADRQGRTRNRCNHEGYESVALIPLGSRNGCIGLIQLNDRRRDMFTPDLIAFYEGIGASIGVSLARKRAEEALRENEDRYRDLTENMNDLVQTVAPDASFVYVNRAWRETLGYSAEEARKLLLWDTIHPDSLDHCKGIFERVLAGENVECIEAKLMTKDGKTIDVEGSANCRFAGDKPVVTRGIYRNVTEQKMAEKARRESDERYRDLVETTDNLVQSVDPDGTITYANRAWQEILGYSKQEIQQLKILDIIHPDSRAHCMEQFQQVVAGEDTKNVKAKFVTKEGKVVDVEGSASCRHVNGKPISTYGIFRDVTERNKLENQLQGAQRMEAVGKLAGGVAHDFNNILSVIMSFGGFAYDALDKRDPAREDIQQVLDAAQRANRLTRQLLAFSRRQIVEPVVLDLNSVVADLEKMLRRVIGEDIEMLTVLHENLGRVKADRGQIEQVFMNLAVNARDAMPTGGKLTIETTNAELDNEYFLKRGVEMPPGSYVVLSVTDNGIGMNEEVKQHIFEPFFTTKKEGKGTGLGLSMIYGIAKQNKGCVWVYSEPGQGTTFKVYLPRIEDMEVQAAAYLPTPISLKGSETILLVEDDRAVRIAAQRMLGKAGYRIVEADSGGNALVATEQHEGPIHLMVTDVVMPRMSGRELAMRLAGVRPEMRVLYMSGYTDNAIVHHGVLEPGTIFLEKPFTEESLLKKVRLALDAAVKEAFREEKP